MADLFDTPAQTGLMQTAGAAVGKRGPGRPKGAKGKRSSDLGALLVAQYEGRTPGQQLAAIALPTAKDRREAKARARTLGVDPETMAMVVKAEKMARAMGWAQPAPAPVPAQALRDAWSIMFAAYKELLPYIHQRLAPAEPPKGDQDKRPILIIDAEPPGGALPPSAFGDIEEDQALIEVRPRQLSQSNSHGDE